MLVQLWFNNYTSEGREPEMLKIQEMTVTVRCEINRMLADVEITGDVLLALRSCGTSRQGTAPRGRFTAEALSELARLGLIGPKGGLTRRGSYAYLDAGEQIEAAQGW